jgi:acetyltransferase-like isoleucine patch superfamily enzyme
MFEYDGEQVTHATAILEIDDDRKSRFRSLGIILDIPNGSHQVPLGASFEPPVLVSTIGRGWLPTRSGAFSYNHSDCLFSSVGRYCSIAGNVTSMMPEHPTNWLSTSAFQYFQGFPIFSEYLDRSGKKFDFRPFYAVNRIDIGHDVWIGSNAFIRGGIKIGNGAIIGAATVVTKDVPPYAIVVGNPGRIIRYRFEESVIDQLQKVEWWRFDFPSLNTVDLSNPIKAIEQIKTLEKNGLKTYKPEWLTMADLIKMTTASP